MIERLTGKIIEISPKHLVLDVAGVGYLVQTAANSNFSLDKQYTVFIYTAFGQEKGFILYGFDSVPKRELFCSLISCHKVGPQTALNILGNIFTTQLCNKFIDCVIKGRDDLLTQQFKISSKIATSIVTQLKEKLVKTQNSSDHSSENDLQTGPSVDVSDVIQALRLMGYKDLEIMPAIKTVYKSNNSDDFSTVLKQVLATLSGR